MSESKRVEIYDTTLRDGTQGEGFSLSLQDKLLIAQKLDELGVDYIEGGFPLSNPKDEAFFRDVRELKLANLEGLEYVTTYRGKQIGEGKKSVTVELTFRGAKTLTSEEVEGDVGKVVGAVKGRVGAELRV